MELFQIFGRIALKGVDDVNRDLLDTTGNAESSSNKMVQTFKRVGGAVATFFAVDKVVGFGKACVEAAASVAAENAAFTQIMGDYSDEAQKKIDAIADATGIASSRMTPYMTSMTAKFKGLGYTTEEATDLASDGLMLAADAAAFWDMSLDDSMGALNSFINGNYEGGEAIGLFANETTVAAWAAENLGMDWDSLSEKEKQFARLEFAKSMQASSGATGQAAKESEAYANVQGNLTEAWRQFQAVIGEPILNNIVIPAMQMLTEILEFLTEKVANAIDWIKNNGDTMKKWGIIIASIAAGVAAFLLVMNWGTIMSTAASALGLVTSAIKKMGTTVAANPLAALAGIVAALIPVLINLYQTNEEFAAIVDSAWASVKAVLQSVWDAVAPIFQQALSWIMDSLVPAIQTFIGEFDLFGTASEAGGSIFQTVTTIMSEALTMLSGLWSAIWPALQSVMSGLFSTLQSVWANIGQPVFGFLVSVVQGILDGWNIIWPSLQNLVQVAFDTIKVAWDSVCKPVLDLLKSVVQDVVGFVGQFFCDNFETMGETSGSVMDTMASTVAGVFDAIAACWQNVLQPCLKAVGDFVTNVLKPAWDAVFPVIKQLVQNCFDAIINLWNNSLKPGLEGIITFVKGVFSGDWSAAWEGIKQYAAAIWEGIKTVVSTAISNTLLIVNQILNGLKSLWDSIWTAIKQKASEIWTNIKKTVSDAVSAVKDKVSSTFNSVKETCLTIWTNIKTTISNAITGARDKVDGIVTNIKTKVSDSFTALKTSVSTTWNNIKEAIQKPIETAKDFVKNMIDKIKGFFDFEWSLPKLKLPHLKITGGFSLSPPKVPKFSIDWYAKGGILEAPTIFGINPTTGNPMAGGEAGPEAVAPIDVLMGYVRTAVAEQNIAHAERIETKFDELLNVVQEMLLALQAGQNIVLDKRVFGRTVREYV